MSRRKKVFLWIIGILGFLSILLVVLLLLLPFLVNLEPVKHKISLIFPRKSAERPNFIR